MKRIVRIGVAAIVGQGESDDQAPHPEDLL
jgi:hypothetical protein